MTEIPTPPEHEKSQKKHFIIEAIICALAVLSVLTLLGLLVLVPVAFAYPIIVGRPKLLYIPIGMASIGFIVWLFLAFYDFGLIIMMMFFFAIVSAFGVGAGFLIRCFRKSQKPARFVATSIGIIILLVPLVFAVELFTGWLRTPFVQLHFRSYLARNIPEFNLAVSRPSFHFKFQTFTSRVQDRNNSDFSFSISRDSGRTRINYPSSGSWSRTLDPMLTQLLEDAFGDGFRRFTSSISGVGFGQRFDLTADNVIMRSRITIATDCSAPETLTAKILRYHTFLAENGFYFTEHSFGFVHPDYERSITIRVSPQRINDDLPALIAYARNNRNQNGNFQRGGNFSYTSHVDFP
ncbi:MAG: hypothetical protein FWB88_01560 [Defluviitaleaceae bacterium]|nr:hypothetical protein [Defluviitaleaceae bacterium]MCL2238916.1 hypothetical protein [Defluviitaleaceae bacterium]